MLSETQLEETLQALAQNDFQPSDQDVVSGILPDMLNHIGSTNSTLRDDLIYSAFCAWIPDHINGPEQLRAILSTVLDDQHLFYRIGEQNTDSVFTRSFSVLLLPLLLSTHRSQPFLTTAEIFEVKEKLLRYIGSEKDRRGFVAGKGWAHAMAHTADALDDLVQCSELGKSDLTEILDVIRGMICITDMGYIFSEEERITTAVIAVIRRRLLSDQEITDWIQGFDACTKRVNTYPEKIIIRTNVKNFLQSLYFRLRWGQVTDKYDAALIDALQEINPFSKIG